MNVGTADLHVGIVTLWSESGLNHEFSKLWEGTRADTFSVVYDQEAPGEQPFPYCVFDESEGNTTSRMSDDDNSIREIREVPISFNIHAREMPNDDRTSKEIAAELASDVMKVFGGHPTASPQLPSLDNGTCFEIQYQSDYAVRTGDDEYSWVVSYLFKVDVPVRT